MLISDLAPINIRGRLVSLFQMMVTMGITIGAVTMFSVDKWVPQNNIFQFRGPMLINIVFCIILACLIWIVPESPSWFLRKHLLIDETRQLIGQIRSLDDRDPSVLMFMESIFLSMGPLDFLELEETENLNDIDIDVEDEEDEMENCSVVRGQPRYLLRTLTGIGLLIFQQCSGVNYFFFFEEQRYFWLGL
ncbi:unnamed protein product [Ambrosiozyma monospora]|uniref:Unnamed protein product n=1 Tax=Ambrosiozyma monospora TaxID=43982 RepID=A0A9W6TAK4_AMBMO|nr:unnamed protein product [Ambrosiozyma monospora]